MAETTGISWTDATFNPWVGCTKVGPGCDGCYAAAANSRYHAGINWGAGAPRQRTTPNYWHRARQWNDLRGRGIEFFPKRKAQVPVPLWVFCASQADVFDNEVSPEWRADLWRLIRDTPHLRWQLVTKRVGNVLKMLPEDWSHIDGGEMVGAKHFGHVGIIATTVNQEEYDRDGPKLVYLKEFGIRWVGLSIEPQLGPIELSFRGEHIVDWVINGGESNQAGHKTREYDLAWGRDLLNQCMAADVPFFMKQIGSRPVAGGFPYTRSTGPGADQDEWPAVLRVRGMPRVYDLAEASAA